MGVLAATIPQIDSEVQKQYAQFVANFFKSAFDARNAGKKLVWMAYYLPSELCYALDAVPFYPEIWGGVCARQGIVLKYLEAAESFGYPRELCSATKSAAGMALSGEAPPPDAVLSTQPVCDGGMKVHELVAVRYKCPHFFIDVPYTKDKNGIEYLTGELEGALKFLTESFGTELSEARLKKVVELSKRAEELHLEVNELRKKKPSPLLSLELFGQYFFPCSFLGGTQAAIDFYAMVAEVAKRRIKEGNVLEEKYRLLWAPLVPQSFLSILQWLELEYKAKVVMEMVGYAPKIEMDAAKPLESLARKTLEARFPSLGNGPGVLNLDRYREIVKDYDIDAVIYFAHWGCRTICSAVKMVKDLLREEFDVPMLVLDGDIFDPRNNPVEQARARVEEFFEMLE
ncbi:MAG: hypothetical protein DRN91_04155 [Candidatus Alkanophagales archaeon]|nr:MAG: hypothetical protein DRN91_04155 [Candidatus Alkanophagales archaeon]